MPAICAACLQPIIGRDSFVIADTEVLHKACARAGRQTELWRTRQALVDAHSERHAAMSMAREAVETGRRAAAQAEQAVVTAAALRGANRLTAERLGLAQTRCAELQNSLTLTAQERDQFRQERDAAVARMVPSPISQPTATPDAKANEDDPMGIAARFALLEFD